MTDVVAEVERSGGSWWIYIVTINDPLWLRMGGFPSMRQAIFMGNSIMRQLGWKLSEPWKKN